MVATIALVLAGGITAAPRADAEVPLVFIKNETPIGRLCLDQHYDQFGNPTTTVFAWTPCHVGGPTSPGNELWWFDYLGDNSYRVVNKRNDFTWCLSAPNGNGTQVYAEYCVRPVPLKQKWRPEYVAEHEANFLRSLNTTDQCLRSVIDTRNGGIVKTSQCDRNFGNEMWRWSDVGDPG